MNCPLCNEWLEGEDDGGHGSIYICEACKYATSDDYITTANHWKELM